MDETAEIDSSIAAREADIARMRHDLEIAEAVLRGMKLARDKFRKPSQQDTKSSADASENETAPKSPEHTSRARGGRQPGSISFVWRIILSEMYHDFSGGFTSGHLIPIAAKFGIGVRAKDARDRLAAYAANDLVASDPAFPNSDFWYVTKSAAKRFGFLEAKLKESEAPAEESEGAS